MLERVRVWNSPSIKFNFFIRSHKNIFWHIDSFGVHNHLLSIIAGDDDKANKVVSEIIEEFKDNIIKSELVVIKDQVLFRYFVPQT